MPVGSNKLQFKCTVCAVSFLSNALLLVHKANHGDLRRDGKLKVWQYGLWSFQATVFETKMWQRQNFIR